MLGIGLISFYKSFYPKLNASINADSNWIILGFRLNFFIHLKTNYCGHRSSVFIWRFSTNISIIFGDIFPMLNTFISRVQRKKHILLGVCSWPQSDYYKIQKQNDLILLICSFNFIPTNYYYFKLFPVTIILIYLG